MISHLPQACQQIATICYLEKKALSDSFSRMNQCTIKHTISCVGKGLHTGKLTSLTLYPAPEETGIKFIRTDIHGQDNVVYARYHNVVRTQLGTTIQNDNQVEVGTIEHLMAALWGAGIDNVIIELDESEVPIMDGSSERFMFMLDCAGIKVQDAPRKYIEILKEVSVQDGDARAVLRPSDHFEIDAEIKFDDALIKSQKYKFSHEGSFKSQISRARTFGFKEDADRLKQHGLAQGASLDNVIVVSGNKILNKGGLRYSDEFVRHKVLDVIGDYYLAGSRLKASVQVFKPGHKINNKVLHALFEDLSAWRITHDAA
jgi:UDP-3-O-[3-hydroxymyristoyl] N-acetylglucosamine deacetylase